MPEIGKPSPDEARKVLAAQNIDPSIVTEASLYPDSLLVMVGPPQSGHAVIIEFQPELSAALAAALQVLGVKVIRNG
jgi:hypothetical protein